MNILFLSRYGDGADLALDALRWGNEVRFWNQDAKRRKEIFVGIIDQVDDFRPSIDWCDYAFLDACGMTEERAEILKKGKPVFGASPEAEKMEKDRPFAQKLFKAAGMKSPESESFKSIEEAKVYLSNSKGLRVVKITGKDADSDDILISEMEGAQDAAALMDRFDEAGKKFDSIEVDERIIGIEVGAAGYFNGRKWIGPIEINFQHKEIGNGRPGSARGVGMLTGETGTIVKYVTQENKFFQKTLGKFTAHLKSIGYRGETDLGTIVDEKGDPRPIEWTKRKGYPDCFLRRELTVTPEPDLYAAIARGEDIDYKTLPGWAMAVLVMVPGFPYQESVKKHSAGYPIFGYDEKNPHMHLQESRRAKDGEGYVVADGCGYAAVVTGRGLTIEAAQRNTYWQLHEANKKRLYIPKMDYRTDIGDRVLAQKDEILELGIMTEAEWG